MQIFQLALAVIILIMIPYVPQMTRFRIKVFRWMGWKNMADIHERGFQAIVMVVRILMGLVAAVLILIVLGIL
jgi:hypothetical protein